MSVPARKHLIMGTAGHIDHGKTALVKALTGIDCDTHEEEKRRGITIHLGFAHYELPTGERIGVVDVPGHAAFVRTMVSGASGIDFALLVIAADEGVMPQTREHLQIMDILGVKSGIVVLNKCDVAARDIIDMARTEVGSLVAGTFLERAPVVEVSARTGLGLAELRAAIAAQAASVQTRAGGEVFRMFVDRIFVVKGHGTVVTGSALSGTLATGAAAYLLPRGTELRVRRLEQFGSEAQSVTAGDRASINLVGLSPADFKRGMVISDRPLRSTAMLDARLTLFKHSREFGLWNQVNFHLGTFEAQVRVHLIDVERLLGGESGLAQLHLPQACVAQAGDRFVLRSTSSDVTLGGGEVIDAFPLHHRRRTATVIEGLGRIAHGKLSELVAVEVRKRTTAVDAATLADALNCSQKEIVAALERDKPAGVAVFPIGGIACLLQEALAATWGSEALCAIASYHRRNPLEPRGMRVREVAGVCGVAADATSEAVLTNILDGLVAQGKLKRVEDTFATADHSVNIDPQLEHRIGFVEGLLRDSGMKTPLLSELAAAATRQGIDDKELQRLLRHLVAKKQVYFVEDSYLHASVVDPSRQKLVDELKKKPAGVTVADFRDLVDGNRKICLLMLALFDREGTTQRTGDVRVLGPRATQENP
jgi:selenocysteine-specific elongation factor